MLPIQSFFQSRHGFATPVRCGITFLQGAFLHARLLRQTRGQTRRQTVAKPAKPAGKKAVKAAKAPDLGALPEWNLADLYPAIDSPEIRRDLDRGEAECIAFEKDYKGKLAELRVAALGLARARGSGAPLRGGRRICSAASSPMRRSSMPATPPIRSRRNSTATCRSASPRSRCIFCSSRSNSTASRTRSSKRRWPIPILGHYRPWIEDVRKEKPYQLEDRIEQLFHEKSVSGYSAWNRLFDETMASLRFNVRGQGLAHRADAQPAAGPLGAKRARRRPKRSRKRSRTMCGCSRSSPTRSPRTRKFPTAGAASRTSPTTRHLSNRVEREVVEALVSAVRASYPRCRIAITR